MTQFTTDTFFNGTIKVRQSKNGYRFSIDAVLLAGYAFPRPGDRVLDMGTGCGIIPLILAYQNPQIQIFGIEVQKEMADIALQNIQDNCMESKITILHHNIMALKHKTIAGPVDLVVSNPPYRKNRSGRICANSQRAIARHEITATLNDFLQAASRILNISGRFITIYPAERMVDMLTQMRKFNLEPKYLRTIHSKRDTGAKLILVEGIKKGRPGIKIKEPIIIYNKNGEYTEELKKIYGMI